MWAGVEDVEAARAFEGELEVRWDESGSKESGEDEEVGGE